MRTAMVWLLFAMVLVVAAPARAQGVYSVRVCIDYKPVYADSDATLVGDDFLTLTPATVPAYGAEVEVNLTNGGGSAWLGNLGTPTGTYPGCSPNFNVLQGESYDVKLWSQAVLSGKTVIYRTKQSGDPRHSVNWSGIAFAGAGGHQLVTGTGHMVRTMAALTYAIANQDVGGTDTINVWRVTDGVTGPCPTTSCNSGGQIYYKGTPTDDHSNFKYTMLHELGHKMMYLGAAPAPVPFDYTLPAAGGMPGGAGHNRNSIEWQSAALVEGFAHFYSDTVSNLVGGVGCGSYSHYSVDWDHDNDGGDGNAHKCDAAPITGLGLSAQDYLADESNLFLVVGMANEYDYQRFFWDLVDKEGLSVDDIADIIGAANTPTGWNPTYDGGDLPDNTAARLLAAANGLSLGTAWNNQDNLNGVQR